MLIDQNERPALTCTTRPNIVGALIRIAIIGGIAFGNTAVSADEPKVLAPENLQVLKEIVGARIALSDKYLEQAEKLTYQLDTVGSAVTFAPCQAIESQMSANYPLHTYGDYTDRTTHSGVKVCPSLTGDGFRLFDGE